MRPKHNRFPTVIASLVAAALAGCSTPPGLTLQPGTAMLVAIGSPSPDSGDGTVAGSGAYRLRENPTRFDILGWRGLSASHITTTEDGRWIYIATDDGVLVSRDGGASFWMTGATVLRSVRRVAAVPDYPHQVFAATSTGVFFTHDITADTDAWRPFKPTTHVQRCNDIQVDIHDTQTVWVASDSGVFLAEPQDPRFRRMTAPTQVHRILQDRTNRDHVWATTDKRGVIKSADGGKTWIQVTGTSGPCYSIAHYPAAPATIIVSWTASMRWIP